MLYIVLHQLFFRDRNAVFTPRKYIDFANLVESKTYSNVILFRLEPLGEPGGFVVSCAPSEDGWPGLWYKILLDNIGTIRILVKDLIETKCEHQRVFCA